MSVPPLPPKNPWDWLFGRPPAGPSPRPDDQPVVIRREEIGREHSGKSAMRCMAFKGPLQGAQPSGLELAASDPRVAIEMATTFFTASEILKQDDLPSTQEPEIMEYHLFEAEGRKAILQVREVVGQVLTHTTLDSPKEQQDRYQSYVNNLSQADVLQVVVSCPAAESEDNILRYEADLQLCASYLRKALEVRESNLPCAVALVISKIDARFASAEQARTILTDDRLKTVLANLVRIVLGSAKVGMAAIFPVSAFGFGKAVLAPAAPHPAARGAPARGTSPLSHGEPRWLLPSGVVAEPFNLTPLFWWTLLAGLAFKSDDGDANHGRELARIVRLLKDDLNAMSAWLVVLKDVEHRRRG